MKAGEYYTHKHMHKFSCSIVEICRNGAKVEVYEGKKKPKIMYFEEVYFEQSDRGVWIKVM